MANNANIWEFAIAEILALPPCPICKFAIQISGDKEYFYTSRWLDILCYSDLSIEQLISLRSSLDSAEIYIRCSLHTCEWHSIWTLKSPNKRSFGWDLNRQKLFLGRVLHLEYYICRDKMSSGWLYQHIWPETLEDFCLQWTLTRLGT